MKKKTIRRKICKKLSCYEELVCVNAKLKAIQEGEFDDDTKDKLCQVIFEDFLRRLATKTQSASVAVRDAEQALKVAKEVLADSLRVSEIIGGLLEPHPIRK